MKTIVIFSGAGMSAESGISTFRDAGGLWENYSVEDVATPQAWEKDPQLVNTFYNVRRKQIIDVQPNSAHLAIATLEKKYRVHVITQNIDDLHERAGSTDVLYLHGNIRYARSSGNVNPDKLYPIEGDSLTGNDVCDDGFPLRPHVVWFGEAVPALEKAAELIPHADYFVVIGTSLNVYPAAGLVHYVKNNCKCYVIDPKADSLNVPSQFEVISKTAVAGIKELQMRL